MARGHDGEFGFPMGGRTACRHPGAGRKGPHGDAVGPDRLRRAAAPTVQAARSRLGALPRPTQAPRDRRPVAGRSGRASSQRTKTPAWFARSRKYWGATPSTKVTATPTAMAVDVSGEGTATVGPSAFGSLKNISTMTRM